MRLALFIILLSSCNAFGGDAGGALSDPTVVARMVKGLADSKIGRLTCSVSKEKGGKEFSYHLKTISYLGTVSRDGRVFTIAAAKFLRSSAKGSQYPPARGYSFLVMFDDSFAVAAYGEQDFADYYMDGEVLKLGKATVVDFGSTEPAIRYHGWMLDGGFMPYPFADRISETDWNSGAYCGKQSLNPAPKR